MIQTYHTTEEITAIVRAVLPAGDTLRRAWEAVPEEDQAALVIAGQADIDACAWAGRRAVATQAGPWPRVVAGVAIAEAQLPDGVEAWSVAGIPGEVRVAHAVQSCYHAATHLGADGTMPRLDHAAQGITSMSAGGQAYAVDAIRADRPRNRLHPRARAVAARWLAQTAEAV